MKSMLPVLLVAVVGCGSVSEADRDAAADALTDAISDVGSTSDGHAGDASLSDVSSDAGGAGDSRPDLGGYPPCDTPGTSRSALTSVVCTGSLCDACIWSTGALTPPPQNCVNQIGRLCAPAANPSNDMFGDCSKCPL